MPPSFPEKLIQEIWQGALQRRKDLVTAAGGPVEVIYPGRRNDDRGADFRDAVIATGQGLLKGDIEIHTLSSSWWAHRHHLDPTYNRVVLHVVFWDDAGRAAELANGFTVPTLALHGYYATAEIKSPALTVSPFMPCRRTRPGLKTITGLLDAAGLARFQSQADTFRETLARYGPAQSLYAGIMTALGYSKNKEPMAELAACLPLAGLTAATPAGMPESECLALYQGLLIGAAGLLPSQRGGRFSGRPADAWENTLENAWASYGEAPALSPGDWRFFKVRPGNHPVRRLAAMSRLLLRYRRQGLLDGLREVLREAAADKNTRCLELSLAVEADSFWGCYLDFGVEAVNAAPALLGRERAAEISVNVILPFAAAGGFSGAPPDLPWQAREIYSACPAPAENALVKHMRQQLGIGRAAATARRQQGLIHLYKTRCSQGKCPGCPLGGEKGD
ncbi:MAG: DUF2851 family protein [Dehalococcoidales bacterium]|jgi:hypothetical protein